MPSLIDTNICNSDMEYVLIGFYFSIGLLLIEADWVLQPPSGIFSRNCVVFLGVSYYDINKSYFETGWPLSYGIYTCKFL
jgi:hypothetical protein